MAKLQKLKLTANVIKKKLKKEDYDWLHVNAGNEGVGKSTFGWHFCKLVDSTFNTDRIVFSVNELIKNVKNSKPGRAIMVDEGAFMLFHRDAMSRNTKRAVKLLTGIRKYNLFLLINVPRFLILDTYIRKYRVKTSSRVVKRGMAFFFSPYKTHQIKKDKRTGKAKWPEYDYIEGFPQIKGPEWEKYDKKKSKDMIESLEEGEDVGRAGKSKIDMIQDYYRKNPEVTKADIARKFEVSPPYVSHSIGRMNPKERKELEEKVEKMEDKKKEAADKDEE